MNPVALITGASRGIGRGIALELAKIGCDFVINFASNAAAARQTALDCIGNARNNGHQIRAEICQADVASGGDRQRLLDFTRQAFGRLDLLVNNAGVAPNARADILEATEESFDRQIGINVKGPYFLSQLAARWMIEQVNGRGNAPESTATSWAGREVSAEAGKGLTSVATSRFHPKIIIVSSISAYTASVNRGDYCISKAGLAMAAKLWAARLAGDGVRVFELRPGIMATDMTAGVKEKYDQLIADGVVPQRRWGTGDDVGRAVCALMQDSFPFSTGDVIHVDGGLHLERL